MPRPRAAWQGPRQLVDVEWRGLDKLIRDLDKFRRQAVPYGIRNGLNATAFEARGIYIETARSKMTLRNTFTERSIQVDKASGLNVRTMESRVGSVAPYMDEQERGTTETAQGKHGVPIPTSFSAGQGLRRQPRTKLVQRPNRLPAIHLTNRSGRATSRAQRNAIAIRRALTSGNRYVFLDIRNLHGGRRKGIYRLQGTKSGLKVRLIWDLSERSVRVPTNPMFLHTVISTMNVAPKIQAAAIVQQMRRYHILGY